MKLAVTFTVNDRPHYFQDVLDSWTNVRGKEDVLFYFSCEPFGYEDGMNRGTCVDMAEMWLKDNKLTGRVYANYDKLGVLHNPYVALQRAFGNLTVDYAVLAEDDLVVSNDILEYHTWAANEYLDQKDVAMICSFFEHEAVDELSNAALKKVNFASVYVWGTWKDRWNDYIGPTWEHEYVKEYGFHTGWDWNLNERVLPRLGKYSIQPFVTRVQNIGLQGTHNQGTMILAPSFKFDRPPVEYVELGK